MRARFLASRFGSPDSPPGKTTATDDAASQAAAAPLVLSLNGNVVVIAVMPFMIFKMNVAAADALDTMLHVKVGRGKTRPAPLSADEVSTILPGASHVVGRVAPLCSLSGTESLLTQFVDPLLKAQTTLGR